jgi:hypothetical protein
MNEEAMRMQRTFENLERKPRKTRGDRNKRYACGCGASTTRNQLKKNGGVCHSCKEFLNV